MTLIGSIRTCFRKYVTFSGRASRPEYWYFILFVFLGSSAAGILDGLLFGMGRVEAASGQFQAQTGGPISALFGLATLVPMLSAGWRRMHDSGRSGLYLFYPIIVMVGISSFFGFSFGLDAVADSGVQGLDGIMAALLVGALIVLLLSPLIVIWWLTRPSDTGHNRFGPPPNEDLP